MTEREALRLLHLDEHCSPDQMRRAYLDMVKVWHPDRFGSDEQLRVKAERTLQSINEAYAVLQGRTWEPGPAGSGTPLREPSAPASAPWFARPSRQLVGAAGIGAAIGVALAITAILRSEPDAAPEPGPLKAPASPPQADVQSNTTWRPAKDARARGVSPARPESGSELRAPRGTGTGQVSTRNDTVWDAAVLLDGPAGARAFFLRRGEQVTLLDLAPGTYRVRVMLGTTWTGRTFATEATFLLREEPASVVGRQDPQAGAHLILVDSRAGMRPVPAFRFD